MILSEGLSGEYDWIGGVATAAGGLLSTGVSVYGATQIAEANKKAIEAQIDYQKKLLKLQKQGINVQQGDDLSAYLPYAAGGLGLLLLVGVFLFARRKR